ncbi:MAG: hypothetical protein [Bacteriophage sp.]|nr:MAG: hypothetical protein [Bacteriophage sp.]UVM91558.1 MAG: hypothetical protein [Bacteriophage sp.]UVN01802.1 MAG: hypothetical protein [Bacteriophage sp.]UVX36046.1 MAG: hypothetical protein [Bacteriophage sp.]UVX80373.1 MAG: hypothetical protein [Bacteriophage sp.]
MNTVELKEGQTYICKETRMRYWTVGKEYPVVLDSKGKPAIIDNGGDYWYGSVSSMLNDFSTEFELVKYDPTPMNKLEFKEGQTYVCTKSDKLWWTVGKEYPVVLDSNSRPVLIDNDGDKWTSVVLNPFNTEFELVKYDTTPLIDIDLNTLTLEQLTEYVDLQQAVDLANTELNKFIEKVSK